MNLWRSLKMKIKGKFKWLRALYWTSRGKRFEKKLKKFSNPLEMYYAEDDGEDEYLDALDHYMQYGDKD